MAILVNLRLKNVGFSSCFTASPWPADPMAVDMCNHKAPLSAHHACAEDRNVKRPHRPSIGGDIWWDRW